jgi:hypothetical protein
MRRSFPAWLAILALTLQALWPLLVHARPANVHLVPLCTIDGVTHFVEIPGGKSPAEQRSGSFHEHCKLCVFGVDRLAAVPAAPLPVLRVEMSVFIVAAPAVAVHVSSLSAPPAPPRAPPALS